MIEIILMMLVGLFSFITLLLILAGVGYVTLKLRVVELRTNDIPACMMIGLLVLTFLAGVIYVSYGLGKLILTGGF